MALGQQMRNPAFLAALLACTSPAGATAPTITGMTAPGPEGALAGTLIETGAANPAVLIIPGSGPTDRDGNNPLGVTAASYRLLAEALADKGVSSLRIDKRGMFGSKAALANANAVTIADYAADVHAWIKVMQQQTGRDCIWVLGHSEGGLVALAAAQQEDGICGLLLVAAPGRKLQDVMREQLVGNPANAAILPDALKALDELSAGRAIDVSAMHPALQSLFNPAVQPFLIDMFTHDPAALAAATDLPILIVQGGKDIQVTMVDADALAAGQPGAVKIVLPDMTHVLKDIAGDDRAANMASYSDSSLPVTPGLVEAIAGFVKDGD